MPPHVKTGICSGSGGVSHSLIHGISAALRRANGPYIARGVPGYRCGQSGALGISRPSFERELEEHDR
jgi:hypothetical protein